MQNVPPSEKVLDHPSQVPDSFTLICINDQTAHTYSTSSVGPLIQISKAFGWSMLIRAHAVGHCSREALLVVVRHLQRFILATGELARTAADIDHDLLLRFARWLASEESGLTYRTAASHFRTLVPAVRQWIGREWAAPELTIPRHAFPELRKVPRTAPSEGYTEVELQKIATCVLSDIAKDEAKQYVPSYLGKPPPVDGVASKKGINSSFGDKWTCNDYRTWWWEENCRCQQLTVDEIRLLPGGDSFIFGRSYKVGDGGRNKQQAEAALGTFYKQIGAGPSYVRQHPTKPAIHLTKWAKFEFVAWYFDNFCEPRWIPFGELRKKHRQLFIALREHHSGMESFYQRIGLVKQYPTAERLCPYYVGLLLTTTFNPSTVQRLSMDCVIEGVVDGKDSIAWTKLRAARSGITIPASATEKLAPKNLIDKVLKLTAPFRGQRRHLFALASPKPQRAELPPNKSVFQKEIRKWFARHGLAHADWGEGVTTAHAAKNFRPGVAKLAYEKTGDLLYVKALLNHSRASTTAEYVGQLPQARLISSIGVHIEAIFADATGTSPKDGVQSDDVADKGWTETVVAHCNDILHSPWPGQRAGEPCDLQKACLTCRNLVVTRDDIVRHFAAKAYYQARVQRGEITQEDVDAEFGIRFHTFEEQIIPRYPREVIDELTERAISSPPSEYRL